MKCQGCEYALPSIYVECGPTAAVLSQQMDVCSQVKLLSAFKCLTGSLYLSQAGKIFERMVKSPVSRIILILFFPPTGSLKDLGLIK